MTHTRILPVAMGALMGPMLLMMLHGQLTGAGDGGFALIAFVLAHVAVAAVVLLGVLFAARLSPVWRARLDRLHRPSWRHVGIMAGCAFISGAIVHFYIHGGASWI